MFLNCLKRMIIAVAVLLAMSAPVMADDVTLTATGEFCNQVLHQWEFSYDNGLVTGTIRYEVTPKDTPVTMTSNNPNVAEVGYVGPSLGNVHIKGFGSTTVTVSAGSQSVEVPVTVTSADDQSQADTAPTKDFVMPGRDSSPGSPYMEMIENDHNYENERCFQLPKSYLVATKDGYMRVSAESDAYSQIPYSRTIHVEYFDSEYKIIAKKDFEGELSLFGGFYNGKNNFFIIYGERNPNDQPDKEVMRVVKYDKDWKRISAASIDAQSATIHLPFRSGNCSFAEYKNILYIHTCKNMFTDSKGLNHQSCMSYEVNTDNMKWNYCGFGAGFVGHSFNQFILIDNRDIVCVDHGDASPRGIQMSLGLSKAGQTDFLTSDTPYKNQILSFKGTSGDNYTNAQIGGLEASGKNYLVAGSTKPDNCTETSQGGIFVSVTPKDKIADSSSNQIKFLSSDTGVNPYLVKFNSNKFLVIWGKTDVYNTNDQQISYIFIDGDGNPLGNVQKMTGRLSDCQPVVTGDKAVWFSSNGKSLDFYSISENGKTENVTSYSKETNNPSKPSEPDNPGTPETPTDPETGDPGNTTPNSPSNPGTDSPGDTTPSTPDSDTDQETNKPSESGSVPIYRLYNRVSMEHLYTTDQNEVAELTKDGSDWNSEGTGWTAPSSGVPAYRLYNPVLHQHLYTTDENEVNVLTTQDIWQKDFNGQPLFYSGGDKPIYRLYQPADGQHLLTTDENEYNTIPGLWGWRQEGVALKGLS